MALIFGADVGVLREIRDSPPSDYLFKIKYPSSFCRRGFNKIQSSIFKAGGHQWRIVFYPEGCDEGSGDHISIYLSAARKNSLADGKEINAICRFFLFDQIRGKYLYVQGNARRFDRVKYQWGFSKFLSLNNFKEPTSGFIVNNSCFLGAEVYVIRSLGILECMSMLNANNLFYNYTWMLTKFSEWVDGFCYSDEFVVGSYRWRLCLARKGDLVDKERDLGMFLEFVGSSGNTFAEKVQAHYTLRLKDQINKEHRTNKATRWFGASSNIRGWDSFIQSKDLNDSTKGFIVNDCCVFEAEVTLLCETYQECLDS